MATPRMTKKLREFVHEALEQGTDTYDLIEMLIDRMTPKDKRDWAQSYSEHREMMGEVQ